MALVERQWWVVAVGRESGCDSGEHAAALLGQRWCNAGMVGLFRVQVGGEQLERCSVVGALAGWQ
jgi:hypothetical protein